MDLDVKIKAVMIGAVFLISSAESDSLISDSKQLHDDQKRDFMFFEKQQNNNNNRI